MERSRELRGLLLALYEDYSAGDPAYVDVFGDDEGVVVIGTDPAEWWNSGREAREVLRAQLSEIGRFEIVPGRLHAFVNGDTGWVIDDPIYHLPNGNELSVRVSAIFERRGQSWVCTHWHQSVGVPNEEAVGMIITTAIDHLAEWAEQERPDLTSSASPQGTVTIVFTDLEASTATNEAIGDERFVPLLLKHNEIVESRTRASDGSVVKSLGDGFMLAFPSARRAVGAMIDVQRSVADLDQRLKVRMGLHTGEPTRLRGDFFGRDVAYAARLGAAAVGGEILVSALVKSLVEPGGKVVFDGPRELELKGFEGAQQAFAVHWSEDA